MCSWFEAAVRAILTKARLRKPSVQDTESTLTPDVPPAGWACAFAMLDREFAAGFVKRLAVMPQQSRATLLLEELSTDDEPSA
jgi:hypothetical protein